MKDIVRTYEWNKCFIFILLELFLRSKWRYIFFKVYAKKTKFPT